jgi:RHS repeat-associated protein
MKNFLQRSLSVLVCILLFNFISIAQETPDPQDPKKQPLEKPTEVKEAPKEQDPNAPKEPIPNVVSGGTPAGQTPTNTQDGTFVNRFQDIPVNLFTGTPIISFPIYTLSESGGASVPLGLSYNASGMRGHDVSGWVGMNWTSNFSFQISRIVRGIPDEGRYTLGSNFSKTARKGFYQYGLKADGNIENDSQPDLFFLNINGQSYKFSFDVNKKAHFYPEADIDVQVTWQERYNVGDIVGIFTNWVINMPDGTKYSFSGNETESSFEMEANEATNGSGRYGTSNFSKYIEAERTISAWYCGKITTAFGHETTFEYHDTDYSFFRVADQTATTVNCTFNGISKQINKVFVRSSTLFKISNQTHVVEINKGGWTQDYYEDGSEYWYLNNTYPARQDIDTYSRFPSNSSNTRALHKITVYAKDDPTKVFEWKFNYDYNSGNDPSNLFGIFTGYNYSTIGYSHQKRFKLRSIEEPNGNRYTFKYYDDGFSLPSRLTQGIDHWGYLNGALGETTLIGEDAFRVCTNNQFGNKTATSGWSQYGTLTAVSHSTGGTTFLEYENHKARNYTPIIGGSRIKKITFVDSISNLKTTKRYDYQQVNGQSSGFLCLKPVYHFDNKENFIGLRDEYWHSGLYQQLLSESGRPAVGYSRVKETILSGDATDSLGYTMSEFLQPLTEIKIQETVYYNCHQEWNPTLGDSVTVCDSSKYIRPWKWQPYHENTVGVSSRVAVYGKNNQILSEKSSVYTEEQLQLPSPYFFQYHSFRLVDKNYNFEQYYGEFYNTYRMTSDTTKMYSQDGTNPVITVSNQEFPTQAKHNQVIKTTVKDSYGSTITNTMKYPLDFQFAPGINSNVEAQGIQALQQKHILSAVIESISKTKQDINSNDEFITAATYQTFYKADSTDVKAGMPKSSFVLENVPRVSMTEANNNPNTNIFVRSTDYDLKTTTNAYTSIGLPIQSTPRFGAVSKINYDETYPTLPIGQVSNVGQPSEQTTSVTYNKILYGVSKQKGANNLEVNHEYYADGKLKQQTDKDGNVLKHIQYVYRGQADNDPLLTTNTGYNRIITRIPRIATTTPLTLTHTDCLISIVYMDGAGRVVENVGYRASPNEKDMISGIVDYDKFNRVKRTWLTIESSQNTGELLDTATVKTIARAFYQDQKPYSEVLEYEASPMSRVFKSYGVGKVWQDSSKYVKMEYQTANSARRLFVNNNDDFMSNGTYPNYELAKTISTDERGSQVIEYKDKAGNVVQKDVQVDNTTNYLTTLFCFDPAGRLRYVFPPKAVNLLGNSSLNIESWSGFNENVYANHYDGRQRIFESHKPGAGWSRVVYNRMNQAVMSQDDDELAKNNTWNYVQKDGQGRTVKTGQMQLPEGYDRAYLQQIFDNFTINNQFEERLSGGTMGYNNNSFPNILRGYVTEQSLKSVSYFDDYLWEKKSNWDGGSTEADYDFQPHPFGATRYANAKGLPTGSKKKHEIWGDSNWFSSVNYFDDKNRGIQNITTNHLLKRNQSDSQINFIGEILRNRTIHRKTGTDDQIITQRMTFDHVGRGKDMYYTLVQGTVKKIDSLLMISNSFDAIGRNKIKFVQPNNDVISSLQSGDWINNFIWKNGIVPSLTTPAVINAGHIVTIPENTTVQAGTLYNAGTLKFLNSSRLQLGTLTPVRGAALQVIEYFYNVRSQMQGVNLDANGNPQVSQDKLFSFKIDHHEDGRYFDGSISKQTWQAYNSPQNRSYLYTYDRANRLLNSQFTGVGNENYSVSNSYDVNGNTLTLQRYGKTGTNTFGLVDNLTYNYLNNGNKLQKIDDAITGNAFANDFRDVSGNDYSFSVDGKMTRDGNKGITSIRYNYLDLVSSIKFANNDSVSYWYSSTGNRIQRKVVKAGQPDSYTIYDGEMIYTYTGSSPSLSGFTIAEIQNSEGRYVNGKLEYGYTDHVGNLRLSYKDSLGIAFITQSQHYDPWSNVNAGSEYQLSGIQGDRYLVSGKENDNITGNTLLDWRDYDSVTGRMNSFDPDATEGGQISLSPFAYSWNNPVSLNDPNGRCPMCIGFMIGMLTSTIGNLASGKMPSSIGQFILPGVTGALGGAASMFAPVGLLPGMGYGAVTGAGIGGLGSVMNGGNFWNGALSGGISGGILGGAFGYLSAVRLGINPLTGTGTSVNAFEMRPTGDEVGEEWFSSTQEMREHYNTTIGTRDNMTIEQVEGKLNTTVDLGSDRNLPKGYSIHESGLLKTPSGYAGGITTNNYKGGWLTSNHTGILIAPRLKGYSLEAQNGVFKHEFMHAWHWNNSPNMQEYSRYSERATSSFSIAYDKIFNLNSGLTAARRELLGAGGSIYPANYSWRNFNKIIPTWIK